ncbi:adenylate/guanylate cyclase domain-containing protein [Paenibacillus cymbidii]|uniref:adenylate/guanylate cyclase domain-containing protein n=1 Tax=Paenibacillus cymbidii TaxID=1639034 RepID=UPI001081EB63|nr:adenylate/guanylate cyclase domain-containing protein [Paenibacillus cymbidii]
MSNSSVQEQSYALYDQGWNLIFVNMKEAVKVIQHAYELSLSIQDPVGIAKYKVNMAIVHYQQGSLELAIQLCMEAMAFFSEQEDRNHLDGLCRCYLLSGKIYWDLGSRDKGIDYLTKGHDIAKTNQFTELEGRALGFLATSYYDVNEYELALTYFKQAFTMYEGLPAHSMSVRFIITTGCIYKELGDYGQALQYLHQGAELSRSINSQTLLGRAYNDLANTYFAMNDGEKAIRYYKQSLEIREQLKQPQGVITTLLDMAFFYLTNSDYGRAEGIVNQALALAKAYDYKPKVQRAYELLSVINEKRNDFEQAYHDFKAFHHMKIETDQSSAEARLNNIRLSHQAEQAEREFQLAKAQNKVLADLNDKLERTNIELDQEKQKSDQLLVNILPQPIAERLKNGETLIADSYAEVTVLFADIVGFTPLSAELAPHKLVQFLNRIFLLFDELTSYHQLEKIKTIGDAYMVVGGIPHPSVNHTKRMADMALDMIRAIQTISIEVSHPIGIRIGIHRGAAVAGVIGSSKFSYDIWGDTVNLASRMESSGERDSIQVTEAIYQELKDSYSFKHRGHVDIKGKGQMSTYYLVGPSPDCYND